LTQIRTLKTLPFIESVANKSAVNYKRTPAFKLKLEPHLDSDCNIDIVQLMAAAPQVIHGQAIKTRLPTSNCSGC